MSSKNGDKSRHHRIRKQNINRRLKIRELREKLAAAPAGSVAAGKTKPSDG